MSKRSQAANMPSLFNSDEISSLFQENDVYVPDAECGQCGSHRMVLQIQHFQNGTEHIRADCAFCSRFIKYLPKTEGNLQRLRQCERQQEKE